MSLNFEFDSFDEDETIVGAPAFQRFGAGDFLECSDPNARDRFALSNGWQMALNADPYTLSTPVRTGPEGGPQMSRQITYIPACTVSASFPGQPDQSADFGPSQLNTPPIATIPWPFFTFPTVSGGTFDVQGQPPAGTVIVMLSRDLIIPAFVTPANMGGSIIWKLNLGPMKIEVIRTNIPNDVLTLFDMTLGTPGLNAGLFSVNTFSDTSLGVGGFRTDYQLSASYFTGQPFYFRMTVAFGNRIWTRGGDPISPVYPESNPMTDG